jgi:carboxymethylenebutenolidase
VHDGVGLTKTIEEMTEQLARKGFLALAVDLLSRVGGTPADENSARAMTARLDERQTVTDLGAAIGYLRRQPSVTSTGCIGFCWGGGMSIKLATTTRECEAAVILYTQLSNRPPEGFGLTSAFLISRDNKAPEFRRALQEAGIPFSNFTFAPGSNNLVPE